MNGSAEKNVLILGAGRVASPLIEYLYRDKSVGITVACEQRDLGDALSNQYPGVESVYLNAAENPSCLQVKIIFLPLIQDTSVEFHP